MTSPAILELNVIKSLMAAVTDRNKREPFSIPNADDLIPIYSNSEAGCMQREPRSPIKFILHTLYATKSSKALLTQLKKKET